MKKLTVLILCALVVFVFGCGEDPKPDTSIKLTDLVGSWKATSIVQTNNSNNSETYEVIAGGGVMDCTVLANSGVRTWITIGSISDEYDARLTLSGSKVTLTPVETSRPTKITSVVLVGVDGFIQTNTNDTFDFTFTGAPPVSTTSVITWQRK